MQNKIQKNQSKNKTINKKKTTILGRNYKKWVTRAKTYSSYPYLLTISFFRKNIFFNLSDFQGQTKYWTNAGCNSFSGSNKLNKITIITVTENFMQKIWKKGIRCILIKFNKYNSLRKFIIRGIKSVSVPAHPIKSLGIITELSVTFNGCRRKKRDELKLKYCYLYLFT